MEKPAVKSATLVMCLFGFISLACNLGANPVALSPEHGIVYEAESRRHTWNIAVLKTDGSESLNLINAFITQSYREPVWSPDGTMIAYWHKFDIYVMKSDGTGRLNLTDHPVVNGQYSWSPDSRQIVFVSNRDKEIDQIFVINADGSDLRQLTHGQHYIRSPFWSPDGTRLAFGQDWKLVTVDKDGSNLQQVTDPEAQIFIEGAWSPDGTLISFTSEIRAGDGQLWDQIFVVRPDGSGLQQLTHAAADHRFPKWSPDSSRIAFEYSEPTTRTDIYVIDADGSNLRRLTDNPRSDSQPSWSPDGSQIAFESERDGFDRWDIYLMNADGSGQVPLTTNPARDRNPDWRR